MWQDTTVSWTSLVSEMLFCLLKLTPSASHLSGFVTFLVRRYTLSFILPVPLLGAKSYKIRVKVGQMFVPHCQLPFGCPGWVCVCVSVPRSDSRGQVTLLTLPPPVYHASPTCSHTHASYICKWSGLLKLPPALTSATLHLVRIWNCFGDLVLDTHNIHDPSLVIRHHLPLIFLKMTSIEEEKKNLVCMNTCSRFISLYLNSGYPIPMNPL